MGITRIAAIVTAVVLLASVVPSRGIGGDIQTSGVRGVKVTVRCGSSPEKVVIKNNRSSSIRIISVGSIWRPRASEPFRVNKRLRPGKRIVYSFGPRRGPNRLTRQLIFDEHYAGEGVKVRTNKGRIKRFC